MPTFQELLQQANREGYQAGIKAGQARGESVGILEGIKAGQSNAVALLPAVKAVLMKGIITSEPQVSETVSKSTIIQPPDVSTQPTKSGSRFTKSHELFDYQGDHKPPMRGDGAPAHDLTGNGDVYPEDVYSHHAVRYYGTGDDSIDHQTFSILHPLRGKPKAKVAIYRAIPHIPSVQEQINELEKHMKKFMARGIVPDGEPSKGWYDRAHAEMQRLKSLPNEESAPVKPQINPGDWVTVNRNYAKQHGESTLRGKYKIIKKIVPAKHIYTNGDSIHEFGYDPSEDDEQQLPQESQSKSVSRFTKSNELLGMGTDLDITSSPELRNRAITRLMLTHVMRGGNFLDLLHSDLASERDDAETQIEEAIEQLDTESPHVEPDGDEYEDGEGFVGEQDDHDEDTEELDREQDMLHAAYDEDLDMDEEDSELEDFDDDDDTDDELFDDDDMDDDDSDLFDDEDDEDYETDNDDDDTYTDEDDQ